MSDRKRAESEKPLPCPFCGEEVRVHGEGDKCWIACFHPGCRCKAETMGNQPADGAVRAWNRRAK